MQQFEVTVKEGYDGEMQVSVFLRSTSIHEEHMYKQYSSDEIPQSLFISRVASAVMSRFCVFLFPRYEIRLELGKPMDTYYALSQNDMMYELRIAIKGYMNKLEQERMVDELNRIVAESQREALR